MYDDLSALFLFWKERTGRSSVLDFADAVFEATNVPLSDLLTETNGLICSPSRLRKHSSKEWKVAREQPKHDETSGTRGRTSPWALLPGSSRHERLWRSAYWGTETLRELDGLRHEVITQLMGLHLSPASTASALARTWAELFWLGLAALTVAMAASTRKKARRDGLLPVDAVRSAAVPGFCRLSVSRLRKHRPVLPSGGCGTARSSRRHPRSDASGCQPDSSF